jgi:hypothetical protein
VAGGQVYWAEASWTAVGDAGAAGTQETLTVKSAPLAVGAQVTTIGTVSLGTSDFSAPGSIAAIGSSVFVAGESFPTGGFAADGSWTPLSGWLFNDVGPSSTLTAVVGGGSGVYAFNPSVPDTPLVLLQGDASATGILSPSPYGILSVASDGASVYWTTGGTVAGGEFATVLVMPSQGGEAAVVYQATTASHERSDIFSALAVDDGAVYWADLDSLVIQRALKSQ